jgi:hypothetical protein
MPDNILFLLAWAVKLDLDLDLALDPIRSGVPGISVGPLSSARV